MHADHPPVLSLNAVRVLENRYLLKDKTGNVCETPAQLFRRVARAIGAAERHWGSEERCNYWEHRFLALMNSLKFLPNSPTLMSSGTPEGQLSACFVLPVDDRIEATSATLKLATLIQQGGGGTGYNFSRLRAQRVESHTLEATDGPVSVMKLFDTNTEHVRQTGKRRGANMGILNIDHPDIEEFISSKLRPGDIRNFNISIGISDRFMETLIRNGTWNLIHPETRHVARIVQATALWNAIIQNAWRSGDPGLIFMDRIKEHNPTPALGSIEATNPCGEVPLLPYESCNLGSLNLSKFVLSNSHRIPEIDWSGLSKSVSTAVRFLDNVIEVNHYASPKIKAIVQGNRKVGLGVMGWAEMLCLLDIPYASGDAVTLGEKIMSFIEEKSMVSSQSLARERGTFNNWSKSVYFPDRALRNATRTSIAPTGTLSIIADTSASIEPFFALAYKRSHVLQHETLNEINRCLIRYCKHHGLNLTDIMRSISRTGWLEEVDSIPTEVKERFRTALQIAPSWHLRHQQAFQKHTDNAVSKTVNLPRQSMPTDVNFIFKTAWEMGLKGITVYRLGSREDQVLTPGTDGSF